MNANLKLDFAAKGKSRRAFTLMEVLLAIAMISLLAFIVVINVDKTMTSSQEKITESFVNNSLATPLMSYKLAIGRYPSTEEGLNALLNAPESAGDRWKGPYVRSLPLDPWGNPYVIMLNIDGSNEIAVPAAKAGVDDINLATSIAIYSYGPNGEDDGGRNQENGGDDFTDDITGW